MTNSSWSYWPINWLGRIIFRAIKINPKCVFRRADWTHTVEEHAVSNAGLNVLWPGIARVFPQDAPCSGLAVVGIQAAELRFWRPTVLHAAVTCQDATSKSVDHVLFRVHAHLQGAEEMKHGNRKLSNHKKDKQKSRSKISTIWVERLEWD